jgi:hypothetical protein
MDLSDAQRDMREVFRNGSVGQLVSGLVWLASAAFGTWGTRRQAILLLVVGGMFIYPLTQLVLRARGRRYAPSSGNPLTPLAMQVAFIVPLTLPVAAAAALHEINWFYPAVAVLVGAHYLPFVTLYGLRLYAVLGGLLIASGCAFALVRPDLFAAAGWCAGGLLVACSAYAATRRPHASGAAPLATAGS